MTTNVTPYCAIGPYDITSIVYYDGIESSGGGAGVEEILAPTRNYAEVRYKGRSPKKYKIRASSADRATIETFLETLNTCDEDDEFYPFDADRFGLIASAHGALSKLRVLNGDLYYDATAEIVCREPWLLGPSQGMTLANSVALPAVSSALTNDGNEGAPIRYLQASGDADIGAAPVPVDISARASDNMVVVCDSSKYIYYSNGPCWVKLPGLAKKVSISNDGLVIIGSDDYPYRYVDNEWVCISTDMTITDISLSDDGTIYAISSSKAWKISDGGWVDLGGELSTIAAKYVDMVYGIGMDNCVWYYDGSWHQFDATTVTDLSVGSGGEIFTIQSGVAYYWATDHWIGFGGSSLLKIAGPGAGLTWAYSAGAIYRWNTGTSSWDTITGGTASYVEDLAVRITPGTSTTEYDRSLPLCDMMLRDDLLELGWRGELYHSYETDFSSLWGEISIDLHGLTSGGSITSEVLTLADGDYMMIPFYGPNPIAGDPGSAYMELEVSALTGDGATCWYALAEDLSDMTEIDHDELVVGKNTIHVPDLEGEGYVAIGIQAAASGSVSLTNFKSLVKRYIAPQEIPSAEPLESFKVRVEASAGTQLSFLEVEYNDRYYY